jgi:hypothetical protein
VLVELVSCAAVVSVLVLAVPTVVVVLLLEESLVPLACDSSPLQPATQRTAMPIRRIAVQRAPGAD